MSKYETIPIEGEAHQQQLVSANVSVGGTAFMTAYPGDWIIKWPDGRLEVCGDADFTKKFRIPPQPYHVNRDAELEIKRRADEYFRRTQPLVTFTDPVMPVGPTCTAH